jgi:phosphohistidine phosphatase SixA
VGTFYVVRHAKSGSRSQWSGDDRLRPLTKKGQKQAEALVDVFEPFPISAVYSSPYLRCVQTVQPLAKALKLPLKQAPSLGEGKGLAGAMQLMGDTKLKRAVLCTHGDIMWELVEELVNRKVARAGEGGYDKGATWVVEVDDGSFVKARYIPAP